MPIKTYGSLSPPSRQYKSINYVLSPRVNGKLVLKTNPVVSQLRLCGPHNAKFGEPGLAAMTSQLDVGLRSSRTALAYAAAYDRFRDKAWNDAHASLLIDIAEKDKSLAMVTDTVKRIMRAAMLVKNLEMSKAASMLLLGRIPKRNELKHDHTFEAFQSNWLAYRYGWLPLMMSAESLLETVVAPLPDYYQIRVSGAAPKEVDVVFQDDAWSTSTLAWRKTRCVIKGKVRVASQDLAKLEQYGLLNIGTLAWEIIPFSFVVDWFTNIGNVIEDLTSFAGLSIEDVSVTYHEEVHQHYLLKRNNGSGAIAGYTNTGYGVAKRRTLSVGLNRPERAYFHNGLNKKRLIDALALAPIIFGKGRSSLPGSSNLFTV